MNGEIKNSRALIMEFLSDYGEVSASLKEKLDSESDVNVLKKWTKLSARVSSIEEFEEKMCDI